MFGVICFLNFISVIKFWDILLACQLYSLINFINYKGYFIGFSNFSNLSINEGIFKIFKSQMC